MAKILSIIHQIYQNKLVILLCNGEGLSIWPSALSAALFLSENKNIIMKICLRFSQNIVLLTYQHKLLFSYLARTRVLQSSHGKFHSAQTHLHLKHLKLKVKF